MSEQHTVAHSAHPDDIDITGTYGEDGTMAAQFSLREIAEQMTDEPRYKHRLKLVFEFFRGVGDPEADLTQLIAQEPPPVGDVRFDAILAASAEYVAYHHDLTVPEWATDDGRTLDFGWFIPEYQQARRWAMVYSPAAFKARGIYIEERDLANV